VKSISTKGEVPDVRPRFLLVQATPLQSMNCLNAWAENSSPVIPT